MFITAVFNTQFISFTAEDFVAVSEQRVFVSQNQAQPICINVNIENDATVETDESFILQIVAAPPVSTLSSQLAALVIIQNDDSKLIFLPKQIRILTSLFTN